MKNNIELAAEVKKLRPDKDAKTIGKAVVKLRKLAKTIRARVSTAQMVLGDLDLFEANTRKFYDKAYQVSHTIDCGFEGHNNPPNATWEFYIRIGDKLERLI